MARGTLVYDGDCGFCRRCAAWIAARLPTGAVVVESQRADLAGLGLSAVEAADAAWWVDAGGRRRGHRAVAAALSAAGGNYATLGRVLANPLVAPLAGAVYAVVAANRHRLGCTNCPKQSTRGGPALP